MAMYVMFVKGLVTVVTIAAGLLALWGLQIHLIETLALTLGSTPTEAWGWGHLGAVPTVLELLAVMVGIDWLEDNDGLGGIVGRVSGFVHVRTCRAAQCWLCSEWMPESIDREEWLAREAAS
jgi:hypothetical protein